VGFVVDKVALGQVFSEYFGFPCQSTFHRLLQSTSSIIWGWYNRPKSGRSTKWTQYHPMKKKIVGNSHFQAGIEDMSVTMQNTLHAVNVQMYGIVLLLHIL
jgi:hypothetical protein